MSSKTMHSRDESELIRLVCTGEKQLFHALVHPCERAVFYVAFSVVGDASDAEDISQETFLKALLNLGGFRGESKFSTWLVQIAFNEARMFLRHKRGNLYESLDGGRLNEQGDYIPRDFADWRDIPSELLASKELRQALQKAIAELKPIYRTVLMLRDVQHFSVLETANILGVSSNVVKTRLLRARLQLRDALAPGYDGSWSHESGGYRKVRPW